MGGRGTFAAGKDVAYTYRTVDKIGDVKVLRGIGGKHGLQRKNMKSIKNILRGYLKLKNGNVQEFIDKIHYGDELVFLYKGKKYFLQGYLEDDGICTTYLDRWEPPAQDYIWVGKGDATHFPVNDFLNQKLWDGRNFWDAEQDMEWVDC